jgi:hypothetical protein
VTKVLLQVTAGTVVHGYFPLTPKRRLLISRAALPSPIAGVFFCPHQGAFYFFSTCRNNDGIFRHHGSLRSDVMLGVSHYDLLMVQDAGVASWRPSYYASLLTAYLLLVEPDARVHNRY